MIINQNSISVNQLQEDTQHFYNIGEQYKITKYIHVVAKVQYNGIRPKITPTVVAVSAKKDPCIKNCISTDDGVTWTKENSNVILIQQNFELGETYTTIKKTDTKIITMIVETALVTILIYMILLPFAK